MGNHRQIPVAVGACACLFVVCAAAVCTIKFRQRTALIAIGCTGAVVVVIILLVISGAHYRKLKIHGYAIDNIHKKLKLKHGSFNNELPEQTTILKYLPPEAQVLEFGGNIGRASLIINHILKDKTKQLTIESDENIAKQLKENRDLNGAKFKILEGVISNKKFIQKGWRTKQSDKLESGWKWVSNYSLEYILKKYNIYFDTIVADCEGCLVGFFKEYPNFIKQIKLIILEHDFNNKGEIDYFKNLMSKNGFKKIYAVRKDDPGSPGMAWNDGVVGDPDFVTVWKK